jgi:predicted Zn-dependent peptidase
MQSAFTELNVLLSTEFYDRLHGNTQAYSVASRLLSKKLLTSLRYDKGLTYNAGLATGVFNHPNTRALRAHVNVDPEDTDEAFAAIKEVMDVPATDYADKELADMLAARRMDIASAVDNRLGRARSYGEIIVGGRRPITPEEKYDRALEIDLGDVREALADTLDSWHASEPVELVTGPKEAVGDRILIDQSEFA